MINFLQNGKKTTEKEIKENGFSLLRGVAINENEFYFCDHMKMMFRAKRRLTKECVQITKGEFQKIFKL